MTPFMLSHKCRLLERGPALKGGNAPLAGNFVVDFLVGRHISTHLTARLLLSVAYQGVLVSGFNRLLKKAHLPACRQAGGVGFVARRCNVHLSTFHSSLPRRLASGPFWTACTGRVFFNTLSTSASTSGCSSATALLRSQCSIWPRHSSECSRAGWFSASH